MWHLEMVNLPNLMRLYLRLAIEVLFVIGSRVGMTFSIQKECLNPVSLTIGKAVMDYTVLDSQEEVW